MGKIIKLSLSSLDHSEKLWSANTVPILRDELRKQGLTTADNQKKYKVSIEILEGRQKPAYDVENYSKPIIDALTDTKLLWADDSQIDEIWIKRITDKSMNKSKVDIAAEEV